MTCVLGAFENEDDATEFVKCKIESMLANEVKALDHGRLLSVQQNVPRNKIRMKLT